MTENVASYVNPGDPRPWFIGPRLLRTGHRGFIDLSGQIHDLETRGPFLVATTPRSRAVLYGRVGLELVWKPGRRRKTTLVRYTP